MLLKVVDIFLVKIVSGGGEKMKVFKALNRVQEHHIASVYQVSKKDWMKGKENRESQQQFSSLKLMINKSTFDQTSRSGNEV